MDSQGFVICNWPLKITSFYKPTTQFPSIYLSQSKKSQVANELMNSSNSGWFLTRHLTFTRSVFLIFNLCLPVLQLIHQLLVEDWPQASVKGQAIKCFTSWLNLGICVVQPENEPLVFLLFDLLRSPTYFMETAEALMQLFKIPLNHKWVQLLFNFNGIMIIVIKVKC